MNNFPENVDCIIIGTGNVECLLSASLAVNGKSVLHIDHNPYYGSLNSSMRFPDFLKLLEQNSSSSTSSADTPTEMFLNKIFPPAENPNDEELPLINLKINEEMPIFFDVELDWMIPRSAASSTPTSQSSLLSPFQAVKITTRNNNSTDQRTSHSPDLLKKHVELEAVMNEFLAVSPTINQIDDAANQNSPTADQEEEEGGDDMLDDEFVAGDTPTTAGTFHIGDTNNTASASNTEDPDEEWEKDEKDVVIVDLKDAGEEEDDVTRSSARREKGERKKEENNSSFSVFVENKEEEATSKPPSEEEAAVKGKDCKTPTSQELKEEAEHEEFPTSAQDVIELLRRVEFELAPKLIFCESETVSSIIQSHVNQYLDFKFVTRCLSVNNGENSVSPSATSSLSTNPNSRSSNSDKLIQIPINREEVTATNIFSFRQKTKFWSFLEWCARLKLPPLHCETSRAVDSELCEANTPASSETNATSTSSSDSPPSQPSSLPPQQINKLIKKYAGKPLADLMRNEKKLDEFIINLSISCIALSAPHVETVQGLRRIQQMISSIGIYGKFPLLWPNYGCAEICQAYSRQSAVFGTIFCLQTHPSSVKRCISMTTSDTSNTAGEEAQSHFEVAFSSGDCVRTPCIIANAMYAPRHKLAGSSCSSAATSAAAPGEGLRFTNRALFIARGSFHPANRKMPDIAYIPLHYEGDSGGAERPICILEFDVDSLLHLPKHSNLFVVSMTANLSTRIHSREVFRSAKNILFSQNVDDKEQQQSEVATPKILLEAYFTLPDFSRQDCVTQMKADDPVHFVASSGEPLESDADFEAARKLHSLLYPDEVFLPSPPDPEHIIHPGFDSNNDESSGERGNSAPPGEVATINHSASIQSNGDSKQEQQQNQQQEGEQIRIMNANDDLEEQSEEQSEEIIAEQTPPSSTNS